MVKRFTVNEVIPDVAFTRILRVRTRPYFSFVYYMVMMSNERGLTDDDHENFIKYCLQNDIGAC